jgi:hypothetical protein
MEDRKIEHRILTFSCGVGGGFGGGYSSEFGPSAMRSTLKTIVEQSDSCAHLSNKKEIGKIR